MIPTEYAGAELRPNLVASMLPDEIDGWKPSGPYETFDRDTLFRLIDGGAEVYRSLNVRLVLSRRYEKPDAPDILADIFDMGWPADAFGAYHHDIREGPTAGIGQESELLGNNLAFWKDRYFVSVVALGKGAEVQSAVVGIGRAVARKIYKNRRPPGLVRWLPPTGLIKSHVHYFHDWPLLNRLVFFADQNLLGLDRRTEGILARYRLEPSAEADTSGPETTEALAPALLLVRYPDATQVGRALRTFDRLYRAGIAEHGVVALDAHRWVGARTIGRLLAVVLDMPDERSARALLDAVQMLKGAKRCKKDPNKD